MGGIPRIIRQRRSTAEAWVNADPVLGDGERAYDVVTRRTKFGDGIRKWSELPDFADDDPVAAPELPNATMHLIAEESALKDRHDPLILIEAMLHNGL